MSKRTCNPTASRTVTQINSTMVMMRDELLSAWYNLVPPVDDTDRRCQITWNNHVPGVLAGSGGFTKLEQYLHILETNSYHCLLFDGSIIRVNYVFEDDLLLEQNLLWWPSPYDYSELLESGYPPAEIVNWKSPYASIALLTSYSGIFIHSFPFPFFNTITSIIKRRNCSSSSTSHRRSLFEIYIHYIRGGTHPWQIASY